MRFANLLSGVAALAMVLGCYTVSLKVSGERQAVETLRTSIARDRQVIAMLQAELRTRARLPELQRWNDEVLALGAPQAAQFVRDPVQLAAYTGKVAPVPAQPSMRYAIDEARPVEAPVRTVAYVAPAQASPPPARSPLVRVSVPAALDLASAVDAVAGDLPQ